MYKSAQFRDYTQPWLERRKECASSTIISCSSTPAQTDQVDIARIPVASSSSLITVTKTESRTAAKKQRSSTRQQRFPFQVKLAEENTPTDQSDSDSSSYNSVNEMETDFCRDESDCSDGYVTDGFATMDVFEYEVDDSSDSEDLYSRGSSSGTDDMVEVMANALFASSSESEDFEIFAQDADTEESDAPTDPELGCADYWTCIKCKNKKNNLMYRYCEKCYQIRKTHFPPRPRHRRKRSSVARRGNCKMSCLSSPSTSSSISVNGDKHDDDDRIDHNSDGDDIGNQFMQKSIARKQRRRKTSHKQNHSDGESSCCSSQELSPDEQQSTLPSKYLVSCARSQETFCSDIEHLNIINKQSNSNLFEHNYPNSQESVYPNSEPNSQTPLIRTVFENANSLSKLDSLASTISAFSVGSSQSSTEGDVVESQISVAPTEASSDICCDSIATIEQTSPTSNNLKKAKKRKIDFADEISDCEIADDELMAKKFRAMDEADPSNGMCMICLTEPKNGAFVHNRFLHVCCCYRCTVKVWNKRKRCPICNSQVKTVLKMFVH